MARALTTRSPLSRGMRTLACRGAAAFTASFKSIKHKPPVLGDAPSTPTSTARRRRPSELHPFTQYAAQMDFYAPVGIGHRAQIPNVTITANPDGRAIRQAATINFLQPFVEFDCASADVGVSRPRHLQISTFAQELLPILGEGKCAIALFHQAPTQPTLRPGLIRARSHVTGLV